jgi:hypothetical protein
MSEATPLLSAPGQGDPYAASRLLPLVYKELRGLAARRTAARFCLTGPVRRSGMIE